MSKQFAQLPTPDPDDIQNYHEHQHGFCSDPTCICKESSDLINELAEYVDEGLASTSDAYRIHQGRVI